MKENQREVVKLHSNDLIADLEVAAESFFDHLQSHSIISLADRQNIYNKNSSNRGRLGELLLLILGKDNGWEAIISYLNDNKFGSLANMLKNSLKELGNSLNSTATARQTESKTFAEKNFIQKLTDYYTSQYSQVRTMFGCNRDVSEVWVPLRLEEKTRNPRQKDNFSHLQLLERLAGKTSVALVKGHPGVGKTTLVQKIAYDWATDKIDQFDLILTVPLRYVGKTADFSDLAADYYTNRLQVFPGRKDQLLQWLKGLGKKLLICFDGLDEYGSLAESPFKPMFQHLEPTEQACPIPFISYKLLITSRPYACEFINRDFSPLRFEISPLDEAHLADFIEHYCETDEGKMKVRQYLRRHSRLVIKVPLILTFVCYLADLREEIPTNLTSLYEKLLGHMLKREIEGNKLAEKVRPDKWKESAIVNWTTQLAFEGCQTRKFEFCPSLDLDVAMDSFACGFLLHKFNFREESFNAEFPHRSVQEFFAALYCNQLISKTDKSERDSVMEEIFNKDSQFGRFFFGFFSVERKKFEEMLDWLNPTFGDALTMQRIDLFLSRLSDCLSDCSEAELFGERLAASLDQFENQIQKEREEKIHMFRSYLKVPLSNSTFQSGLNLNGTEYIWSISHVDQPRWSRLARVQGYLHVDLREKLDKIQILYWGWGISEREEKISSLDLLPEVSTLIISPIVRYGFEVNFHLEYEPTTTMAPTVATTQLRHFCFQFDKHKIKLSKEKFKNQLDGLTIGELHKTGKKKEISWVTVKVKKRLDRSHLLSILIRMACDFVI